MKKNLLYRFALLALLPALVLTSCRFEDDDYFDESAALRIEHQADAMQEQLVGAPNGWVMQMFCASDVAQFEGFNLFARFENNSKATLASDHRLLRYGHAGQYTEASSVYELLKEDGLVLAFNVWNDVLTPFSDPVKYWAAPDYIIKDGTGMHGDHNFVVMKRTDNDIIMRGERHQAEVRLVKCDRPWTQYISDTQTLRNKIANTAINDFRITNGSTTLYFSGLRNGKFLFTDNLDVKKQTKVDSMACVFTPDGFRIEREQTIGGNKFHEFTLASDNTCLVNEDGTVRVYACWDNYIAGRTAVWTLDETLFSAEQQNLLAQLNTEIKNFNTAWTVAKIGIGRSTGTRSVYGLVITFYRNAAKTQTQVGGVAMTQTLSDVEQLTLAVDPETDKLDATMEAIVKKAPTVEPVVRAFAATLAGVYHMTPDDYFLPTSAEFTPVNGGTTFKLTK